MKEINILVIKETKGDVSAKKTNEKFVTLQLAVHHIYFLCMSVEFFIAFCTACFL
jgi:hypothetical protein